MTHEIERRVVAFVRIIADRCSGCLRGLEENCARCDSRAAKSLLNDIMADASVTPKDCSLFARMQRITKVLACSATPILSSEIDLGGTCSNQLKLWTLKRMIRMGVVGRRLAFRTRSGKRIYRYFLKKQEKQETKNERQNRNAAGAGQDTVLLGGKLQGS